MNKMKSLVESISNDINRISDDATPIKVSKFVKGKNHEERYAAIESYFGDSSANSFTYTKFKHLFRTSLKLDTPFGIGLDNAKKIKAFGERENLENKETKERNIVYNEYVETFFIYLYYQVFIKVFSSYHDIITKNTAGIAAAKSVISRTSDKGNREDLLLGLENLYRSVVKTFIFNANNNDLKTDEAARSKYLENFINDNIDIFTNYPMSARINSTFNDEKSSSDTGKLVDALYDIMIQLRSSSDVSNQQVKSVSMFSNFINNSGTTDFDVDDFSGKNADSYNLDPLPKFSTSTAPLANEILNGLCSGISDSTLDSIGLSWVKNSKWKPFVKIVCGLMCLTEISGTIKKASESMKMHTMKYVPLLDTAEKDGGIHFINNMAFYEAIRDTQNPSLGKAKNIIADINDLMGDIKKKTSYFQGLSGMKWVNSIFVKYDSGMDATDYKDLDDRFKRVISNVMTLTGLNVLYGSTDPKQSVANINAMFFEPYKEPKTQLGKSIIDYKKVISYASRNVADYVVEKTTGDSTDTPIYDQASRFFRIGKDIVIDIPTEIATKSWDHLKNWDVMGTLMEISKVFSNKKSEYYQSSDIKSIGNKQFTVDLNGQNVYTIKSYDDFRHMLEILTRSMGAIMCHGKIMFSATEDTIYNDKETMSSLEKDYYNPLSWLILNVIADTDNKEGYKAYGLSTRITPFFAEVLKYSLRSFINNIHKLPGVDSELSKKIDDINNSGDTVREGEWKELVNQLKDAISGHIAEKFPSSGTSTEPVKPVQTQKVGPEKPKTGITGTPPAINKSQQGPQQSQKISSK